VNIPASCLSCISWQKVHIDRSFLTLKTSVGKDIKMCKTGQLAEGILQGKYFSEERDDVVLLSFLVTGIEIIQGATCVEPGAILQQISRFNIKKSVLPKPASCSTPGGAVLPVLQSWLRLLRYSHLVTPLESQKWNSAHGSTLTQPKPRLHLQCCSRQALGAHFSFRAR